MGDTNSGDDVFSSDTVLPTDNARLDITMAALWAVAFYGMAIIFCTCRLIDRWKGPQGRIRTGPGKILAAILLSTARGVKSLQRGGAFTVRTAASRSQAISTYKSPAAAVGRTVCQSSSPRSSLAPTCPGHQHFAQNFKYQTMAASTSTSSVSLKETLTPALLQSVHDLWFEHLDHPDAFILPEKRHDARWFWEGKQLDAPCVEKFKPALETIRAARPESGQDIITAANPTEAKHWLSLILLLDQVPRNAYRDEPAAAFTVFDPLARDVTLAAIVGKGLPESDPWSRWQFGYRRWFLMPFMHSEEVELHREAIRHYEALERDIESLLEGGEEPAAGEDDGWRMRAAKVAKADAEAARTYAKGNMGAMEAHYKILERFGRYPHRNEALGRESTGEEREYLEGGGETFSSG